MTAAILKQAREALQNVAQELHHIDAGPVKELDAIIAEVESASAALDAHTALSPYDKAIHALAIYLGEGEYVYWSGVLRRWSQDRTYLTVISSLEIPPPPEGDDGARRITHNSDGTVTVERG